MKKTFAIVLALVMILGVIACTPKSAQPTTAAPQTETKTETKTEAKTEAKPEAQAQNASSELAGEYEVKVWVADKIVDLTKKEIDEFNATNTLGIVFKPTIQPVSESVMADNVLVDVDAAGELFIFPTDQYARLLRAGALSKLGVGASKFVEENSEETAVAAAKRGDSYYAYPVTSDNTYFMYYDKSVIPEADIDSLEKILADCENNDKYFAFETESSGWYLASWFFGAGCKSDWTTNEKGDFISLDDDFNSDKGLIAVKGMKKLLDSKANLNGTSAASAFEAKAAVLVSGSWEYETAKKILGDNLGIADLPSFEVDGQSYHLGGFWAYKMLGVKQSDNAVKNAALHQLAQYLAGEKCQKDRFDECNWIPANKALRETEEVKTNEIAAAINAQFPYTTPQGDIGGTWWSTVTAIATEAKAATTDEELKAALQHYQDAIYSTIGKTGYVLVGAWGGWDVGSEDYKMAEEGNVLTITLDVPQSDYMGGRICPITKWDSSLGYSQVTTGKELLNPDMDPAKGSNGDNNIVFAEAGNYTVTCNLETKEITIVKN